MTRVNSKKELYRLLPPEYQGLKTKKLIGKIFSLGASNYWTVEYNNLVLKFTYENDFIRCVGQVGLSGLTTVPEIDLDKVLFKQSGFEVNLSYSSRYNYYYFLTSDNTILSHPINNYYSLHHFCLQHKRSDFVSVGRSFSSMANEVIKRNPDCFRKLEWNEFGSYSGMLCVKDCGHYHKGMVIDTYSNHLDYKYHERTPLDLVGHGHYGGMYRINNCLSCDLSKVTLEQLETINTSTFTCSKQKYGCQRGCTYDCYSESANKSDSHRKKIFIKLWKECFE